MSYSIADVVADIKDYEGLKIALNIDPPDTQFNMLYSKCFDRPLGEEATVNDFQKRFRAFFQACVIKT